MCLLHTAQNANNLSLLQSSTVFWINESLVYGSNVRGKGCCYHARDGQDWLSRMGCHVAKAGGIEMYSTRDYVNDRGLWGAGGVLAHELCHAYHDKHVPGGYNNKEILDVSMLWGLLAYAVTNDIDIVDIHRCDEQGTVQFGRCSRVTGCQGPAEGLCVH